MLFATFRGPVKCSRANSGCKPSFINVLGHSLTNTRYSTFALLLRATFDLPARWALRPLPARRSL